MRQLDCRRRRNNRLRACRYTLAAHSFSVSRELPLPDCLPLGQSSRQGRLMPLKPLPLEQTGVRQLDCRRRRNNRLRACRYTLAAHSFSVSRELPIPDCLPLGQSWRQRLLPLKPLPLLE
jgi:hypothetical protein